jgi:hypothetical protein
MTYVYNYGIALASTAGTSGTGIITSSGTTLSGNSSNFDPELSEGTIIKDAISGQVVVVATRSDDTHATLVTAPAVAISASTWSYFPLINVESLTALATAPKGDFFPWLEAVTLGSGMMRAAGRPWAKWLWSYGPNDYIPRLMREALRVFCPAPAKSSRVYIQTKINENDIYQTFSAIMHWPDAEKREHGVRLGFEIEFRNLVLL